MLKRGAAGTADRGSPVSSPLLLATSVEAEPRQAESGQGDKVPDRETFEQSTLRSIQRRIPVIKRNAEDLPSENPFFSFSSLTVSSLTHVKHRLVRLVEQVTQPGAGVLPEDAHCAL